MLLPQTSPWRGGSETSRLARCLPGVGGAESEELPLHRWPILLAQPTARRPWPAWRSHCPHGPHKALWRGAVPTEPHPCGSLWEKVD